MDDDKVDLIEYLPEYLRDYKELQQIMSTESVELQVINSRHGQNVKDRFITMCGDYGMERFEKMLNISPLADDTLESRRFRVMARWNNTVPYNYEYLKKQLELLCGANGYRINIDVLKQSIEVRVGLVSKNMLDEVRGFLDNTVPCNILMIVDLLYNQHFKIGAFTNGMLKNYTYAAIRNEVVR